VLLDGLFGDRGLAQTIRARRTYEQAATALSMLRQENAGLREQARSLAQDPATIESLARGQLGLVRRGEILVRISH